MLGFVPHPNLLGLVSRFAHTGFDGDLALYEATLVPWLWFLTRTTDCRIFQDQTVPDIVKEIFREHGSVDFEEFLIDRHRYQPWDYCVQYRETDFAFVSRLLEQEGIYYYFKHEDGRHILVLADNYGAHDPIPGYEEIPYYPPDETALRERDHISSWSVAGSVQSGVFVHTDFDFEVPRRNLLTERLHPHEHARWDLEVYEYPGGYTQRDQGDQWVRARMEEQYVDYETVRGAGNARGLTTGALFTLTRYPRRDQNREYLIVSAKYKLQSDAFGSSGEPSTGPVFHCEFTVLDARTPYRPPRNTPKARVEGLQTAIVVGKAREEIWTDKYGRVKVQFHWDRYGKSDEHSSCWIRVSHPWAGKNWGAVAIPRIGQEVIVDFLEGDPDRPIITGRVYNDVNKPPYQLPNNAAISGLKSNSTKGGSGYNEYILDDTKGQELIREHGQFDKASTIEHDLREHVGHDRSQEVGNNEAIRIGNDRSKTVANDETITIGGDRTEKVGDIASLQAQDIVFEAGSSITLKVNGGYLVVDRTGVTVSNVPPNQPVINRNTPPLAWLGGLLDGLTLAQALIQATEDETPFVGEEGSPFLGEESPQQTRTCRGKLLHKQEQDNSCAQAATRMLLHDRTGKLVAESQLRRESAARFARTGKGYQAERGTDQSDIPKMLRQHGVPNARNTRIIRGRSESAADVAAQIEAETNKHSTIVNIQNPSHAVVVDGFRTDADGTRYMQIRDPGIPGDGGCREIQVDGVEWNGRLGQFDMIIQIE